MNSVNGGWKGVGKGSLRVAAIRRGRDVGWVSRDPVYPQRPALYLGRPALG